MKTAKRGEIGLWTACFASRETEAAFSNFVFGRNLAANVGGASLGLVLFVAYIFSDYIDAVNPDRVAAIRLATFAIGVLLMSSLLIEKFRKYHDPISATVLILMGAAINLIVYTQPSLDNTYYIALIQGFILFTLLLRLSFISMTTVIVSTQVFFVIAAFSHDGSRDTVLQSVNLLFVGLICITGSYLLQRYQRVDFLKSQTIQRQNTKLNILLDDVRRDHERKLAAMNMLVHFVKTPLHQINGFSEILMSGLIGEENTTPDDEFVESARYIKDATTNLSNSVNRLLTYHRLDEIERKNEFDNISIDEQLRDFSDMLDSGISINFEGSAGAVNTVPVAVKTLFESLSTFYNDVSREAPSLDVVLSVEANAAAWVIIRDNCAVLTHEKFLEDTKPLTKIDNYLTSAGSEMPMMLRTVARAVELIGGRFEHETLAGGNVFKIRFLTDSMASRVEAMSGLKPAFAG
jgi:signal transduction histidine kinase